MAIIFELWAECEDPLSAHRFLDHFSGLRVRLMTGTDIAWQAEIESASGVRIWSPDLSRRGIVTVQDAVQTTEAGIRLIHHLLTAPDFRYSRMDWDAGTIPMAELADYLEDQADGGKYLGLHCVVDDALWNSLGRPRDLKPFRSGYRWHPYDGERYRPLSSQDHRELWDLRERLLPP